MQRYNKFLIYAREFHFFVKKIVAKTCICQKKVVSLQR